MAEGEHGIGAVGNDVLPYAGEWSLLSWSQFRKDLEEEDADAELEGTEEIGEAGEASWKNSTLLWTVSKPTLPGSSNSDRTSHRVRLFRAESLQPTSSTRFTSWSCSTSRSPPPKLPDPFSTSWTRAVQQRALLQPLGDSQLPKRNSKPFLRRLLSVGKSGSPLQKTNSTSPTRATELKQLPPDAYYSR
ncbi:movement protein [Persimmon polerovirus]|uniref:Movement protein n=1 Tax=Persimmon polerovirus TaxID=2590571 RepID=A0A5K7VWP7_9VIRU|nr:movement protein [Persimmon polerovirus]